jgi:serine/threonine protein phosphatase 1
MDMDSSDSRDDETQDPLPAPMTYAIGDIHGEAGLLRALLARLPLRPQDTLVFLGDAINRGPDSLGVVRQLLALGDARPGETVCLMGNHEETWSEVWEDDRFVGRPGMPGDGALARQLSSPADHADLYRYLQLARLTFEDSFAYYAHAGATPAPGRPFDQTPARDLLWGPAGFLTRPWRPRDWGAEEKPIVFGHYEIELADTYRALGIVDAAGLERYLSGRAELGDSWAGKPAPNKLGIDTWAWQHGTLTALRLPDRVLWQTSERDREA